MKEIYGENPYDFIENPMVHPEDFSISQLSSFISIPFFRTKLLENAQFDYLDPEYINFFLQYPDIIKKMSQYKWALLENKSTDFYEAILKIPGVSDYMSNDYKWDFNKMYPTELKFLINKVPMIKKKFLSYNWDFLNMPIYQIVALFKLDNSFVPIFVSQLNNFSIKPDTTLGTPIQDLKYFVELIPQVKEKFLKVDWGDLSEYPEFLIFLETIGFDIDKYNYEQSHFVLEYHEEPKYWKFKKIGHPPYFGFELEVEFISSDNLRKCSRELEKASSGILFYQNKDRSLRNGLEIITNVFGAQEIIDVASIIFSIIKNNGGRCDSSCGLHIAIDRTPGMVEKVQELVTEYDLALLPIIGQRSLNDYCKLQFNPSDKYTAFNLTQSDKTIELRFFNCTLDLDEFIQYIQFTSDLVQIPLPQLVRKYFYHQQTNTAYDDYTVTRSNVYKKKGGKKRKSTRRKSRKNSKK
jgi:hypothetical protein